MGFGGLEKLQVSAEAVLPLKKKPSELRIVTEKASVGSKQQTEIIINNPFHRNRPLTEKQTLTFTSPKVKDFVRGKKNFRPDDQVTVEYVDRKGRLIEARWPLNEYLRRVGFNQDVKNNISPFDRFSALAESSDNLSLAMKTAQQQTIQQRIDTGYKIDQKLATEDTARNREQQLRSQQEEDPFFALTLEGSGYVYPVELPVHNDYLDAIDVMVELDVSDFDETWQEEPVYLGVQRTLLAEHDDQLKFKEEKLKKQPMVNLPEFPDRNPILRVLYRENPEEYYLSDESKGQQSTSKLEALQELSREANRKKLSGEPTGPAKLLRADKVLTGNTLQKLKTNYLQKDRFVLKAAELKMIAKTLDMLYQAEASVRAYLTDQNRPPQLQNQYEKTERAITRMISIIETDNDLSRAKIIKLTA